MKRKLLTTAVVLAAMSAGLMWAWAVPSLIVATLHPLRGPDGVQAQVWERVFAVDGASYGVNGTVYHYTYTIFNDFYGEGISSWGYDDPRNHGAQILYHRSPTGWTSNLDLPWVPGQRMTWSVTGGDTYRIGLYEGLDTFWIISPQAPDALYAGYVSGDRERDRAYGDISGPTPEPVTLALLALGLPAGLLIRRRERRMAE